MKKLINKYKEAPIQLKASFWFLVCSFLQKGIQVITTPIFTRIMPTSDYGRFGVFVSWYSILSIIIALALTGGVHSQGLVKFERERHLFTSALQGLTFSLVIIWFFIYFLFRFFWNSILSLSTVQITSMFIIIWTTSVFEFWANEQRVIYSYKTLVFLTVIVSIVKPIVEIGWVLQCDDKATARVVVWAIINLLSYGWIFVYQIKKGGCFFSKKYWLYAISFNIPLIPHYLSQNVLSSADRIMIQRMIGESESGIYNLAYSISLVMTLFNVSLMQTLNPWIYTKIKESKIKDIEGIAYLTLTLVAVVNLILIYLSPEVVRFFAPKTFLDAIIVIPPVAMSVFFMYSYDLFAKFAFYYEKTKIIMIASISCAVLNLILNYVFIGLFGYIAAGYTTLVCYMFYALFHYLIMKDVCKKCCDGIYPYNSSVILFITIIFMLFSFLALFTYKYPLIRYIFVFASLLFIYLYKNKIKHLYKILLREE